MAEEETFWGGWMLSGSKGHTSTHRDSEQILTSPCQSRAWWVLGIWGHERHANEPMKRWLCDYVMAIQGEAPGTCLF
jgi:hypothetical protein